MKILLCLIIIMLGLVLPYRFWEAVFDASQLWWAKLRRKSLLSRGGTLLSQLDQQCFRPHLTTLMNYKFYTGLVHHCLKIHFEFGLPMRDILKGLRSAVRCDVRFERKLRSSLSSAFWQNFFCLLMVWGFVFLSIHWLEANVSFQFLITLLVFHVVVLWALPQVLNILKMRRFGPWLIVIQAIIETKMSFALGREGKKSHNLSRSHLSEGRVRILSQLDQLSLEHFQKGRGCSVELDDLLEETFEEIERDFERFLRHQKLVQFMSLALCILPSYFAYLLKLMHSFYLDNNIQIY